VDVERRQYVKQIESERVDRKWYAQVGELRLDFPAYMEECEDMWVGSAKAEKVRARFATVLEVWGE
jgi:hypothetical protein